MNFIPINYDIEAIKNSVAYQYIESENLIGYIEVLLSPLNELETVFTDILNKRSLTDYTSNTLDIWGILIDQTREVYDTSEFPFFGVDAEDAFNPVKHLGFSDISDPEVDGGIFRSLGQSLSAIQRFTNGAYLPLLKGKQYKNNFKGGTEKLLASILDILGITEQGSVHVEEIFTDPTDPYVKITFYVPISLVQKSYFEVLKILPKPGGIRYEYIYN